MRFVPAEAYANGMPDFGRLPHALALSPGGGLLGVAGSGCGTVLIDLSTGFPVAESPAYVDSVFFSRPDTLWAVLTTIGEVVGLRPKEKVRRSQQFRDCRPMCADPDDPDAGITASGDKWARIRLQGFVREEKYATPKECRRPKWLKSSGHEVVGASEDGAFSRLPAQRRGVEPLFQARTRVESFDFAGGLVAYVTHNHTLGFHRIGVDPAGEPGRTLFPPGRPRVTALSLSPDGRRLALAHGKGLVSLYDVERPQKALHVFDWQVGEIGALCHAPDGTQIAAAGAKGVVVWDAE